MIYIGRLATLRGRPLQGRVGPLVPAAAHAGGSARVLPTEQPLAPRQLDEAHFRAAILKAEEGPTRDMLFDTLGGDLVHIEGAGLDLGELAAKYPHVPEDALPFLAAAKADDVDGYFETANQLFQSVSKSKDNVRTLRSLLVSIEMGGTDSLALVEALAGSGLSARELTRAATAMLSEGPEPIPRRSVDEALDALARGKNPADIVEQRLHAAMVDQLNLRGVLDDARVKVTEEGRAEVAGPLAQFFAQGVAFAHQLDQGLLQSMLVSVLESKFQGFRFQTPAAERQLASLTPGQRAQWMASESMTHVRFGRDGQARFDARVRAAARLGQALHERMTKAWGELGALRAQQEHLAGELRALDKNDPSRRERVEQIRELPRRIEALAWAESLSQLSPDTTTPLRFEALAEQLPRIAKAYDGKNDAALFALGRVLRINDLSYSHVVSDDGPSLGTINRLFTNCVRWPSAEAMAYMADANKRIIVTRNQAGEERRAVLRLVERMDVGHEGEPMLLLERSYPNEATRDEKQRLIEHTVRRAADLGVPVALPTEYYWDIRQTSRFQGSQVEEMNDVIEGLQARYDMTARQEVLQVRNVAGNMASEYIDSAPPDVHHAGQMGVRRYPGNADTVYANKFVLLEPRAT